MKDDFFFCWHAYEKYSHKISAEYGHCIQNEHCFAVQSILCSELNCE